MPLVEGKYVAPDWQNGGPPAIDADELNAMSQKLEDTYTKEETIDSGVFALYGKSSTDVPSDVFEILSKAALLINGEIQDILGDNSIIPGNCKFYVTSYTGTNSGSASITFPSLPRVLFIYDLYASVITMIFPRENIGLGCYTGSHNVGELKVSTSGNTVIISDKVLNYPRTYYVTAILEV